jgi:hypothetical protein
VTSRRLSTPEQVFAASPTGLAIYHRLRERLADLEVEFRTTRSQVSLLHDRPFAYLWYPGRYVRSQVPAVLSLAMPARITSARFKQVVLPAPHVTMHHLELSSPDDLDDEVLGWLVAAYEAAGDPGAREISPDG